MTQPGTRLGKRYAGFLGVRALPSAGLKAFLLVLILLVQWGAVSWASFQCEQPLCADPMAGMLLPRERTRKSLNQIYEFDRSPLGNRLPVLLVPGRAEEFQHDAWWKRFHQVSDRDPSFNRHFKLYVFLYNSKEELDVQARGLAADWQRRFGHLPKSQPLMLVVYSLGGVIVREIFEDASMLDKIDTIFAISVPFHGSPIFEPAWFSEFLNPASHVPIRRFWDRTIYRAYMFDKSNLTRGMGWDNFDGSKPQFHVDRTLHVVGDQVNVNIPPFEEYRNADAIREKTIVYASYLKNPFTESVSPEQKGRQPKYKYRAQYHSFGLLGALLPLYGFTVHAVFNYTNYQLANLATYTPEDPQGRNTNLYRFNDGAIPMSSMLFLPSRLTPYTEDVMELARQATVKKTRIMVDIDHVDMGEYNLHKKRLVRTDILHPEDGERSPNQWILYDLNQRACQLQSLPK